MTSKKDSYISLRKSLDAFSNVALAQYALSKSDAEKKEFSDEVFNKVKEFLHEVSSDYKTEWADVDDPAYAEKMEKYIEELLANPEAFSACPPGFRDENGICVPI